MSELLKRVLFAVPAAVFALYISWLGGWYFNLALLALAGILQYEVKFIADKAGFRPDPLFPYIIGAWIMLIPMLPYALEIGLGIFLLFVAVQVFKTHDKHIQEFISTLFCGIYVPFGLLSLELLRGLGSPQAGFIFTITFFLMIWGNDVFAYFGGKLMGRRLLAPDISPKKTWEGFLFGFLGAAVGLFLAMALIPYSFPLTLWMVIPAIAAISIFGPLGDLAESKLKRAADVKDASNILPGHGGFFDRFDAIILAAPAFYLYLRCLQIIAHVSF